MEDFGTSGSRSKERGIGNIGRELIRNERALAAQKPLIFDSPDAFAY
jgi:hypothetical protein